MCDVSILVDAWSEIQGNNDNMIPNNLAMIFDRTNGTNRILWVRILELRKNLVQHCVLCCQMVELSFLGLDRTFSDAKYLAIF